MKLRAGVAGAGSMGRNHARCYSLIEEARLEAVYDADLKRAREIAEETARDMQVDLENATTANDVFKKLFKRFTFLKSKEEQTS